MTEGGVRLRGGGVSEKIAKPPQVLKKKLENSKTQVKSSSWLSSIGKLLLVILVVPPMLNYAGLQKEREYLIENRPGQLFDVGFGHKMYMDCKGEGKPTIILDAATGRSSDSLLSAQSELSSLTRVCVYDRAGLGNSQPAPVLNISDPGEGAVARTLGPPSTVIRMVTDLHRLVTFSDPQPRPLILVGTELGGLVAQVYSHLHPQDVANLILLQPLSHTLFDQVEDHEENPWLDYWFGHLVLSCRLLQVSAMSGLSRLALLSGLMRIEETPDNLDQDTVHLLSLRSKHHLCDPWQLQAVHDEHVFLNQSLAQAREVETAWPLAANISTTIISGSYYDEHLPSSLNRGWSRAVQELIHKLESKHHIISGADRHTMLKPPLVEEALAPVKKIIRSWRSGRS